MSLALPTPMPLVLADLWSRTRLADVVTVVSAAALGPLRGALGQLLYVLAALVGLPVLAQGAGGAEAVFRATAGYLLGFIVAGYLVGALAKGGWSRTLRSWRPGSAPVWRALLLQPLVM